MISAEEGLHVSQSDAKHGIEVRQLTRLSVLIDSVYALVIVLAVSTLPTARDVGWTEGSPWAFIAEQREDLGVAALGLFLVVGYWLQNNAMIGSLERADNRFAALSIVQIVFLLLYLYSMSLGIDFKQHEATLAIQSSSLLLMGLTSLFAWRYATHERRLMRKDVPEEHIAEVRHRMLPEPLTATLTLIVSPLGADAWALAWLAFPLISWVLGRLRKQRASA
jgi:uncharacterized membrane protein